MPTKGAATLARPIRPAVVLGALGEFAPSLLLAPGVPIPVALLAEDWRTAGRCAVSVAIILAVWAAARRLWPSPGPDVRRNEALVVAALCFLAASASLVWPLMPPGIPPSSAIFEAVSAITSTGLSTFGNIDDRGVAVQFVRSWGQWYGGLAILVLALALTVRPGVLAVRLGNQEAARQDFLGSTRWRAMRVLVIYVALTVLCIAVLWAATGSWRQGLMNGLTAVSTAGFATQPSSLAGWSPTAQALAIVFSVIGAVSLLFWYRLAEDGWRHLLRDREAQTLIALIVIGALLAVLTEGSARPEGLGSLNWSLVGDVAFASASAQSTTGFSIVPTTDFAPATQVVLIGQMMIGADMGSTGGGIKVARFLVLLVVVRRALLETSLPEHAVAPPRLRGKPVDPATITSALLVVCLYVATVTVAWGLLTALAVPPLPALFEAVSATSTVGLSAGVAGPDATTAVKMVLAACMLLGRMEFLALLVFFMPHTWKGG